MLDRVIVAMMTAAILGGVIVVFKLLMDLIAVLRAKASMDDRPEDTFKRFGLMVNKEKYIKIKVRSLARTNEKQLEKGYDDQSLLVNKYKNLPNKAKQLAFHSVMMEIYDRASRDS